MLDRLSRGLREGITWEVVQSGTLLAVGDTWTDSRVARHITDPEGIRAALHVPITVDGEVFGVFGINYRQPRRFTGQEERLLLALAQRAALAIENARLFEQAQGKAALEERQRLARELHDSVSQALFSIALGARTARTLLDRDPTQVAPPLDYVLNLAEAGLAEMRALIFELRPESLETGGAGRRAREAGGGAERPPRHRDGPGTLRRAGRAARGQGGALPDRPGGAAQRREARPGGQGRAQAGPERRSARPGALATTGSASIRTASSPATSACARCESGWSRSAATSSSRARPAAGRAPGCASLSAKQHARDGRSHRDDVRGHGSGMRALTRRTSPA